MTPLHFIANWKMHGCPSDIAPYLHALDLGALAGRHSLTVCPPATLIGAFCTQAASLPVQIGGQDCHPAPAGAHTGDIAAAMLRDLGASHVILGHSERRSDHAEDNALVRAKIKAAWQAELCAILCIGENASDHEQYQTLAVVTRQLTESLPATIDAPRLIIAYEPIWAIGTGKIPEPADIDTIHAAIRDILTTRFGAAAKPVPVVYGGSVNPGNARAIMACHAVDGCLVGGASLKGETFSEIIRTCA